MMDEEVGLTDILYIVPPVCSLGSRSPEQLVRSYRKKNPCSMQDFLVFVISTI